MVTNTSVKIVEQVTNYINFLEIEQNTSKNVRGREKNTEKPKLSGTQQKVLQNKNFRNPGMQKMLQQQHQQQQQRSKLLSLNHRICTCTSNDDDKTAICEAHAKFNKHFSIDFLLKHPPPPQV